MKTGKFGVKLCFYAVLSFVLAILGQPLIVALLLGFVMVTENDDWTTKQVMQGFFLSLFTGLLNTGIGVFQGLGFVGKAIGIFLSAFNGIVLLVVAIFVILAISNVIRGDDANIPLIAWLSEKAFDSFAVFDGKIGNDAAEDDDNDDDKDENRQAEDEKAEAKTEE